MEDEYKILNETDKKGRSRFEVNGKKYSFNRVMKDGEVKYESWRNQGKIIRELKERDMLTDFDLQYTEKYTSNHKKANDNYREEHNPYISEEEMIENLKNTNGDVFNSVDLKLKEDIEKRSESGRKSSHHYEHLVYLLNKEEIMESLELVALGIDVSEGNPLSDLVGVDKKGDVIRIDLKNNDGKLQEVQVDQIDYFISGNPGEKGITITEGKDWNDIGLRKSKIKSEEVLDEMEDLFPKHIDEIKEIESNIKKEMTPKERNLEILKGITQIDDDKFKKTFKKQLESKIGVGEKRYHKYEKSYQPLIENLKTNQQEISL